MQDVWIYEARQPRCAGLLASNNKSAANIECCPPVHYPGDNR